MLLLDVHMSVVKPIPSIVSLSMSNILFNLSDITSYFIFGVNERDIVCAEIGLNPHLSHLE